MALSRSVCHGSTTARGTSSGGRSHEALRPANPKVSGSCLTKMRTARPDTKPVSTEAVTKRACSGSQWSIGTNRFTTSVRKQLRRRQTRSGQAVAASRIRLLPRQRGSDLGLVVNDALPGHVVYDLLDVTGELERGFVLSGDRGTDIGADRNP